MAHVRQLPVLTLEAAKAMAAAAEAYSVERGWTVAVAVVNATGGLILFHCMDDTQPASEEIAVRKARTAARLRRSTKVIEDAVAAGRVAMLSLDGAVALEGGVPVQIAGRIVGALGVSGMTSALDGEVAQAALAALRP
jgi:glc operon protein GlcG